MNNEWLYALIMPIGGWIWRTEARLTKIEAMRDTVERTERQVDKLVDKLIGAVDVEWPSSRIDSKDRDHSLRHESLGLSNEGHRRAQDN
jgi:hypothetical protein